MDNIIITNRQKRTEIYKKYLAALWQWGLPLFMALFGITVLIVEFFTTLPLAVIVVPFCFCAAAIVFISVRHYEKLLHDRPEKNNTPAVKEAVKEAANNTLYKDCNNHLQQFLSIFDGIPDIIYVMDPDTNIILFANKAFKDLLQNDVTGKICYQVLYDYSKPCDFCNLGLLSRLDEYRRESRNHKFKRDFLITDRMITWTNGKKVRFEIAVDITRRKQHEETLTRRLIYEKQLSRCSKRLMSGQEQALPEVLSLLLYGTGATRNYLFEYLADRQEGPVFKLSLQKTMTGFRPLESLKENETVKVHPAFSSWITSFERRNQVKRRVKDLGEYDITEFERDFLKRERILSLLLFPIFVGSELYGFLGFDNTSVDRVWKKYELNLLQTAAEMVGFYLMRKQNEEDLEQARYRAEAANRAKSDFLAAMSHEIRTPMNAVLGFVELLLRSEVTEEQENQLQIVKSSANGLIEIINDILDFSKIEAGRIDIVKGPANIRKIVRTVTTVFEPAVQEKAISLKTVIDGSIPPYIACDAVRVRQILMNLVGNSVKFTEQGSINIYVKPTDTDMSISKQEDTGDVFFELQIVVEDTGTGIPEDKLEDIFTIFSQVDGSSSRKYGGTGLGLTISRRLARMMGGEISVESALGRGSTFFLNLPVGLVGSDFEADHGVTNPHDSEDNNITASANSELSILLVEDNHINSMVAEKMISKWGYAVYIAADGRQAIDILKHNNIALILMDVEMPVMNGYEATYKIRKGEAGENNSNIHITAMTAHAFTEAKQKCIDAGMNDFITKPIEFSQLKEHLAQKTGAGQITDT